jgi:CRP-like cAMP-binding protein
VAIIDGDPAFRRLKEGEALVEQGDVGSDVYLLFDGVLMVEIDGKAVAELGPGAVVGEMALLDGNRRTATLRAVTPCRIAVVAGDQLDRDALAEVARGRREPDD